MQNITYKPHLSTLAAVQEALAALIEVELPTIQLKPEPTRKNRRPRTNRKNYGKKAASRF